MFTDAQINAAIEAEVAEWSRMWSIDATDEDPEEARDRRRWFHRANVNQGHLGVLKSYLGIIPVMTYRLEEAREALAKLAKKAERYGTPPIRYTIGDEYQEERRNSEGRKYKVSMTDLIFASLEAPKVGEYQFIAKIERTDGGNIVDCVPGETIPESYWNSDGTCEHCRKPRDRRNLYVVRSLASGQLTQVGHSCLRDFMGTDTPASVAARFRFIQEIRGWDEEFGGLRFKSEDSALELLAVTSAAIRLWGWVPRSAPESAGEPTVERVAVWFARAFLSRAQKEDLEKLNKALGEDDFTTAQATLDWVASPESGDSDFIRNLRVILAPGMVAEKRRGYACAAVASYQRHLGRLEEARRAAENTLPSEYVGKVGERLKGISLKVEASRGMGGYYGETVLYKFLDDKGNRFSWFSSGGKELKIGETYKLDATVKGHQEYKGVKETQLTRGKVHE